MRIESTHVCFVPIISRDGLVERRRRQGTRDLAVAKL